MIRCVVENKLCAHSIEANKRKKKRKKKIEVNNYCFLKFREFEVSSQIRMSFLRIIGSEVIIFAHFFFLCFCFCRTYSFEYVQALPTLDLPFSFNPIFLILFILNTDVHNDSYQFSYNYFVQIYDSIFNIRLCD